MTNSDLAEFAVDEDKSRGRLHREDFDDMKHRSVFGRDRYRIINSAAFRRLQYKTQVFANDDSLNHGGDHFRTRLTHSLEVAQIARWIAGVLRINKDLAEIVSLAHDLGHTPFGHAGEIALNEKMKNFGGFSHNAHTLKLITQIENYSAEFPGLNLSWEMLEGVVKHNGAIADVSKVHPYISEYNQKHDLDLKNFSSLEAQISAIADDIAYNNHDLEDGLRAGLFEVEDILQLPLVGEIYREMQQKYPQIRRELLIAEAKKRLVLMMVLDVVKNTKKNLTSAGITNENDVRKCGKSLVNFSAEMESEHQSLKKFLMQNMYTHPTLNLMTSRAKEVVGFLFDFYFKSPQNLPHDQRETALKIHDEKTRAIFVSDYVAGMTDRFAMRVFEGWL